MCGVIFLRIESPPVTSLTFKVKTTYLHLRMLCESLTCSGKPYANQPGGIGMLGGVCPQDDVDCFASALERVVLGTDRAAIVRAAHARLVGVE